MKPDPKMRVEVEGCHILMKKVLLFVFFTTLLFSARVEYAHWKEGESFSEYLSSRNVPSDFLGSISESDRKFLSDILSNSLYYELLDTNNTLIQALIPIGDEMQIHLFTNTYTKEYGFDIIPIEYKEEELYGHIVLENNIYTDVNKTVASEEVAQRISYAMRGVIDAKKLQKGDEVFFTYIQRTRLGKVHLAPKIQMVCVKTKGKEHFIYVDEDGYGYKEDGKSYSYRVKEQKKVTYTRKVKEKRTQFRMPVRNPRITSHFNPRRWHPILKRYRPHNGTDFGGRRGVPLLAIGTGRVSFSGWKGGYGKVVQVKHKNGFESLYAHMSKRRVKRGQKVKRGEILGYMGNTGRSTGTHLHLGLKYRGRWVNPMRYLNKKRNRTILKKFTKVKEETVTKYKDIDSKDAKVRKEKLIGLIESKASSFIWTEEKRNGTI
jgi:murein DD-endopeptidase MepM/ murein hydrolase activator NlpD